jgi:acetyl-CoA synthetase (ADP-forming)
LLWTKEATRLNLAESLDPLFYPQSIAIVGASAAPEKVGSICLSNLLEAGFKGRVYPVNPGLSKIMGVKAYSTIRAIPDEIDLALIAIPAPLTIDTVEDCAVKGVKVAIIISGGFKELGTEGGLHLQTKLRDIANQSGMRIVGPNTVGLANPAANLVASFQSSFGLARVGSIAVVSQSGGMCAYIVHALTIGNSGISKVIGLGNRCNLDFEDLISYLAVDKDTRVIALYIEGLEHPRRLMEAAHQTVKSKPIVVLKGGRGELSRQATFSHTGALVGRYEFYQAAFRQSGMITVDTVSELVDTTKSLTFYPPPMGNRVAVLSVQAGPGIVIADRCREQGLKLAEFSLATAKRLRQLIPPMNFVGNPLDISWKFMEFDTSREILNAVLADNGVNAVIIASVFYDADVELIRAAIDVTKSPHKPIVVCLDSPGGLATAQIDLLEKNGIPTYPLPERTVTGVAGLVRYGEIMVKHASSD